MNSCFAIICHKNKILLFLRDDKPDIPYPNEWHLPGGGRDEGETPRQSIERELKEEITHVPEGLKLIGDFKKKSGYKTLMYSAFLNDSEVKLIKLGTDEGQTLKYFTLDQIKNIKLTPGIEKYVNVYEKQLKKALKIKSFEEFEL